ncbi:MAG: hypothetical protein A2X50_11395 [Candidatus Rokubacteria bacterium GWF2_70_14]|nr:MAG: hypothetical protein A2X50_11395 [Candidatus Rokubacteria bacterium GWF2_70_14]
MPTGLASRTRSLYALMCGVRYIDAELFLEGALDATQLAKLREAAETCRISRALSVPVNLRLTLV